MEIRLLPKQLKIWLASHSVAFSICTLHDTPFELHFRPSLGQTFAREFFKEIKKTNQSRHRPKQARKFSRKSRSLGRPSFRYIRRIHPRWRSSPSSIDLPFLESNIKSPGLFANGRQSSSSQVELIGIRGLGISGQVQVR
ncbi:hypothetical protein TWF225_010659 [Orbilia oligospora]|nr:hypothetical protein TWF225_010659 [Orbilia oligospora]KAF3248368.1 hypothetical protein TWF128_008361 [Orbilia oligospora]KAF3256926.1 hypothetical protein TWF217_006239 [Orbilia oligospora]KAF3294028.1 hypothetical protein TWF132_003903 [Orbilia oligospora]